MILHIFDKDYPRIYVWPLILLGNIWIIENSESVKGSEVDHEVAELGILWICYTNHLV